MKIRMSSFYVVVVFVLGGCFSHRMLFPMQSFDGVNNCGVSIPSSDNTPVLIFDFFGVLFSVDKVTADAQLFSAENTSADAVVFGEKSEMNSECVMSRASWPTMDLGIATKEDVARECTNYFSQALLFIDSIGEYILPIKAGMYIFNNLYKRNYYIFSLSNLSKYCLAQMRSDEYFKKVNGKINFSVPNIFSMIQERSCNQKDVFTEPEGYSCTTLKGLGKPNVLCYRYFLALNSPRVSKSIKEQLIGLRKEYRRAEKKLFVFRIEMNERNMEGDDDSAYMRQYDVLNNEKNRALDVLVAALDEVKEAIDSFAQRCVFIDDSIRNLFGARAAGIKAVSCRCHAVAYWTLVRLGLLHENREIEAAIGETSRGCAELNLFESWSIEQLQDYNLVEEAIRNVKV